MYALRPERKSYLVGSTVGSIALGIGMRWRETVVDVVERRQGPQYETGLLRRVAVPESAVMLLKDLGVTEHILRRQLRPAKAWRFVTHELVPIREGDAYPGCAPSEPSYHVSEGQLLRSLRGEYLRFGGGLSWGTEAYDPFEAEDATGRWFMRKDYGPASDADAILSFSNSNTHFKREVIHEDPHAIGVLFDMRTGLCRQPPPELLGVFGKDFDVVIAVGATLAVHMWQPFRDQPAVAWRLTGKGRTDTQHFIGQLHPALQTMIAGSGAGAGTGGAGPSSSTVIIPATTPSFRNDMQHVRVSVVGDALLPVDPFEWRGDRTHTAIQEAAALVRYFYGKKFSRGHVPEQLREFEQDALARRAELLRRDLADAEQFLGVRPELPTTDEDGEETLRRVGSH